MKRIDKIYNYVLNNSKKFTKDKLLEKKDSMLKKLRHLLIY